MSTPDQDVDVTTRVLTRRVHERRLRAPGYEQYTVWWVAQVLDVLRSLPVEQRLAVARVEITGWDIDARAPIFGGDR